MEIRRDFYLDKLIKRKNNGLIKVITGIRRCGKSYLLNNLFYHHLLESGVDADHIIRFAFDSADDLYLIGESLIQIEKEKRGVDPEKLHDADFHIEGSFGNPAPIDWYNKYIEGGHGHTVAFIHKAAYIKGWRVEDQKQFFHLRGIPQK